MNKTSILLTILLSSIVSSKVYACSFDNLTDRVIEGFTHQTASTQDVEDWMQEARPHFLEQIAQKYGFDQLSKEQKENSFNKLVALIASNFLTTEQQQHVTSVMKALDIESKCECALILISHMHQNWEKEIQSIVPSISSPNSPTVKVH